MNFMYNVATNGIGGVMCGGIESDVVPCREQHITIANARVYSYLTKDKAKAEEYINQGMLTVKRETRYNINGRPYTYSHYTVTQKIFDTYRARIELENELGELA